MKQWQTVSLVLLLSAAALLNIRVGSKLVLNDDNYYFSWAHPQTTSQRLPRVVSSYLPPNASFGACLMMKEDNELLYEWLAYHYLMLPLRYLMIGSDEGNTQDPREVLQRWNKTGLEYWVINDTQFIGRHGPYPRKAKNETEDPKYHHHKFMYRQKAFITTCAEFLKERGVKWVVYIDSDEFIVINRLNEDDKDLLGTEAANNVTFRMRRLISEPRMENFTVLDAINQVEQDIQPLHPCVVLPRLRFGALEQFSCSEPGSIEINELAKSQYNFPAMSTLRYKQHAGKVHFAANKYGKVFLDLSQIPDKDIGTAPPNVHRPFKNVCPFPVVWFTDALFTLNHYSASWERYSHREDERRNCNNWIELAFHDQSDSCYQHIFKWLPRFVQQVGSPEMAQFLLGVDLRKQSTAINLTECPPKNYDFTRLRKKYGIKTTTA